MLHGQDAPKALYSVPALFKNAATIVSESFQISQGCDQATLQPTGYLLIAQLAAFLDMALRLQPSYSCRSWRACAHSGSLALSPSAPFLLASQADWSSRQASKFVEGQLLWSCPKFEQPLGLFQL